MDNNTLVAIGIVSATVAWVYRKNLRSPKFSADGSYETITPFKHDAFKQVVLNIVPALFLTFILGLAREEPLFSTTDFFGSVIGKSLVEVLAYFVYYHVAEPYIVSELPTF